MPGLTIPDVQGREFEQNCQNGRKDENQGRTKVSPTVKREYIPKVRTGSNPPINPLQKAVPHKEHPTVKREYKPEEREPQGYTRLFNPGGREGGVFPA